MDETMQLRNQMLTDELIALLRSDPDGELRRIEESFLPDTQTLPAFLRDKMKQADVVPSQLIEGILISKSAVYQILSGERVPGRDILLRLALFLHLSLEDTQQMLRLGQKGSLYPKVRRDAAIICALEKGVTPAEAHAFLCSIGERPLL